MGSGDLWVADDASPTWKLRSMTAGAGTGSKHNLLPHEAAMNRSRIYCARILLVPGSFFKHRHYKSFARRPPRRRPA